MKITVKDIEKYFDKHGETSYFTFKSEYHFNHVSTCRIHRDNNGNLYGYDKISGDLVPVNEGNIKGILSLGYYYNHEVK